ncbi:MAG: hypothetical protein HOY79_29035 [Streptomyces sp.]|nr:hypothetical protein [Streptomyces sp.]
MSYETVISTVAVIAGGLGLGSGARARVKASAHVSTIEVWREEAEAQKARGDRLEAGMASMRDEFKRVSDELTLVKGELVRLTKMLRAVAPELVSSKGGFDDDD